MSRKEGSSDGSSAPRLGGSIIWTSRLIWPSRRHHDLKTPFWGSMDRRLSSSKACSAARLIDGSMPRRIDGSTDRQRDESIIDEPWLNGPQLSRIQDSCWLACSTSGWIVRTAGARGETVRNPILEKRRASMRMFKNVQAHRIPDTAKFMGTADFRRKFIPPPSGDNPPTR